VSRALALVAEVVAEREREGCRDWPTDKSLIKGYPVAKIGGRAGHVVRVSHLVLEADGRPHPGGAAEALHSCDRPICYAPWHLRWGARAENNADALQRGRVPLGEAAQPAKLTNAQATAIREDARPQAVIAAEYGVSQSTVSRIRAGLRYNNPNGLYLPEREEVAAGE
jgi:hypothetical protein